MIIYSINLIFFFIVLEIRNISCRGRIYVEIAQI